MQHYCAGALLPTEEAFTHTRPAVIARERSLRPKQSPTRQGDGFVSLAMTGTARCHCERALFATEAISNPAGRWLRFVRLTKYGQDLQDKQDCCYGVVFVLPLAVIARERSLRPKQSPTRPGDGFVSLAMTGTARCHCGGALFATEAISNPAGRWLHFVRHNKIWT